MPISVAIPVNTNVVVAALRIISRAHENARSVLGQDDVILGRRDREFQVLGREGELSFAVEDFSRCGFEAVGEKSDLGEEDRDSVSMRCLDQSVDVIQELFLVENPSHQSLLHVSDDQSGPFLLVDYFD